MGTWISHLRIAENLLAEIPNLDATMFACGSLSPDSGLPNANWTQFDPPKEVTHFLDRGQAEGQIKDLNFYRQYLLNTPPDAEKYAFLLGYFFHLICDNLWAIRIGEITKKAFAFLFEEYDTWGIIKKDWYGLDFKYLRDNPNSLFWNVFLNAPNPPNYLPYLPENALAQQLNYIRKFYSEPNPNLVLDREYPYLNEATMTRYVNESTALILQIYHLLQQEIELDGQPTALHLLPDFEFVSYKMPIGDLKADNFPILMCPYDPNS